jgi:hypothetical protein
MTFNGDRTVRWPAGIGGLAGHLATGRFVRFALQSNLVSNGQLIEAYLSSVGIEA